MKLKKIEKAFTLLFAAAFLAMLLTFCTGIALMSSETPLETFKDIISAELWLLVFSGALSITMASFLK